MINIKIFVLLSYKLNQLLSKIYLELTKKTLLIVHNLIVGRELFEKLARQASSLLSWFSLNGDASRKIRDFQRHSVRVLRRALRRGHPLRTTSIIEKEHDDPIGSSNGALCHRLRNPSSGERISDPGHPLASIR